MLIRLVLHLLVLDTGLDGDALRDPDEQMKPGVVCAMERRSVLVLRHPTR